MENPVELIIKKRSGDRLSKDEIETLVSGYLNDSIPDYQMSAFLMALFLKGMDNEEIHDLTEVYIESGISIAFPENYRTVDKHSTGGVGDKISLTLAPVVAACGAKIPMISGRGLGHTGGTLDKLESIPGFKTDLSEDEFRQIIDKVGFSIISQTISLVPADRKIYALRDVTGTVESLPLITASIISKKIAEGAHNLVIDLKVGTGAFIKDLETARELGRLLKTTGERLGQQVNIVYTDMNVPLGFYIGNALEIKETIEYLQGIAIPDIDRLTRYLAARMLILSGKAVDESEAMRKIEQAISSGKALEQFARFIKAQGGNEKICDDLSLLPQSKYILPVKSERPGYIQSINCQKIGYALLDIGAGRKKIDSILDYSSGAYLTPNIGDYLEAGQEIGRVYCNNTNEGESVIKKILAAYQLSEEEPHQKRKINDDLILDLDK